MFVVSGRYLGYLPDHYAADWVQKGIFRSVLARHAQIKSPFIIAPRLGEKPSTVLDFFIRELVGFASEVLHRTPHTGKG